MKETCPTCLAIANKDFLSLSMGKAIEVAHIAGMAVGVSIAGGHSPAEARDFTLANFCPEHAQDLLLSSGYVADAIRRRTSS